MCDLPKSRKEREVCALYLVYSIFLLRRKVANRVSESREVGKVLVSSRRGWLVQDRRAGVGRISEKPEGSD